ncbi:glycosyltransferase [Patulibacter sp.]|uniref:glycosyltransferase n=1 Tax=Patulibacter sp. TaxID=1912859 RepID=UPI002716C06E|nr:glycosyltransferase [Patulibacter sp.]MDO9408754.1 glycosyltransferase [Patulibacter sp.]
MPSAVATPLVSFCVVGTDGAQQLRACLDAIALEQRLLERPTEVLVLDNASADGSARIAREHPVGARVVALPRREGKAANDSRLLDEARGRYALLLGYDTELRAGATKELLDAMERDPGAACAGGTVLSPEGEQRPSAWRFPTLGTTLAQALLLHRSLVVQSGAAGRGTRKVDWCQSACLMVRVEASATIGHLDPEYFVFGDEVDLQRRLRDAGWHTLFVPAATCVRHERPVVGEDARRRVVELHRNQDRYLVAHHGPFVAWCCRPVAAVPYLLRAVAATVLPGHSVRRYWWHVRAILAPRSGEGVREAAERYNAQLEQPA